jgi:succinate-acetate transporter protein
MVGGSIFVLLIYGLTALHAPNSMIIAATIGSMMILVGGSGLIISNCLSLALEDYQHVTGTASSVFGCYYYSLISLFTFGIGFLHNDTLFPLPLYLCGIVLLMWIVYGGLEKTERQRQDVAA